MPTEIEEAIETLRRNIEYAEGRFLKDDGTAADDEFRMSLDAMKEALAKLRSIKAPKEPHPCNYVNLEQIDQLREAPEPTEFTKKWRHLITGGDPNISGDLTNLSGVAMLEACDIIDQLQAEKEKLIEGQKGKLIAGS